MTPLGTIIIVLVCMGLGYIVEPMFISGVKKKPATQAATKPEGDTPENPKPKPKDPDPTPTIQVDLSNITQADFPEKIALKESYTVSDAESGTTVTLKAGSMVKPIRLEGNKLVIQPSLIPIQSTIDIDKTNFKELAVPKMLERMKNPDVAKNPDPVTPDDPDPVTPDDPDPVTPDDPDPAPAASLDEAAIVALLKADVGAGKVTEFKADQVTVWKAGEDMEFDGESYQTGRVTFKAETILGEQEHEAIALIKDGKVFKWMWAKTKLEMR